MTISIRECKFMLSYKEYLAEVITDIVFHKTTVNNIISILNDNRFRLTLAIGTPSEVKLNKNRFYYFSTARSPQSIYISEPYVGELYIELDGRKLSQTNKGFAIEYWSDNGRRALKHELEDRIVSNKQYINNAKSYINAIHVLYSYIKTSTDFFTGEEIKTERNIITEYKDSFKYYKQLYILAKKNNIPIYFYTDVNSYLSRNKRNTVNFMGVIKSNPIEKEKVYSRVDKSFLDEWIELLMIPFDKSKIDSYEDYNNYKDKKLSKRANKTLYKINYNKDDALSSLNSDIHNRKKTDDVGKLLNAMKKFKLKTPKDVITFIYNKFNYKDK